MEELQVIVDQNVGEVKFANYEIIKEKLQEMMTQYEGAVFSDESIKYAKKEVAALRKMQTAIDTRRKEVKKKCLEPYEYFEEKAAELKAIIEKPITLIDTQIADYEVRRKEEKKLKIKEIYDSVIDEYEEYLPLEKIYDNRWENATTTVASIKTDIEKVVNSTAIALSTIATMNSDAAPEALNIYKNTLSITDAIAYINDYEQKKIIIQQREAERQARLEQERIEREQREEQQRIRMEQERIEREQRESIARADAERQKEIDEAFAKASEKEEFIDPAADDSVFEDEEALAMAFDTAPQKQWIDISVNVTEAEYSDMLIYLDSIGIDYKLQTMGE